MKGRRRCLVIASGSVVILTGLWTAWNVCATRNLERAVKELRKAGLPVSLRELYPPPIPPGEDAAPFYEAAFALLDAIPQPFGLTELESDLPKVSEEARTALPAYDEALELAHRAAKSSACRFPVRYEDGYAARIPHVAQLRRLGQVLAVRAVVRAESNDLEGAQDDLKALFAMTRSLRDEPLLVSQAARFATAAAGLRALEVVLARAPFAAAVLDRVRPDDGRGGVACGLRGEAALALSLLDGPGLQDLSTGPVLWTWRFPGFRGPLIKSDLARLARYQIECLRALDRPYPEAIAAMDAIEKRCAADGAVVSKGLLAAFSGVTRKEAELAGAVERLRK